MDPKIEKYVLQPAIVGALAGGATAFLIGSDGKVPFTSFMEFSPAVSMGLIAASSDIVGTVVTDAIADATEDDRFDEMQRRMIKPALVGGVMAVSAPYLVNSSYADTAAILKVGMLGASSSAFGKYLAEMAPTE